MKVLQIGLRDDDQKAERWIEENLSVCAVNQALSRKLWQRFSAASGSKVAIIPEWFPIDKVDSYDQGWVRPDEPEENPINKMLVFVEEYLQTSAESVVVCDNSENAMKSLEIWTWSIPPRFVRYQNQDVYYLLDRSTNRETLDAAISDSVTGRWGVAICTQCKQLPTDDSVDEDFVDEVVANTKHVLMPAFDSDGFLIWTPEPSHSK